MAQFFEHNDEQKTGWKAWVSERPESVQKLARKFPITHLFRLKTTGQFVAPIAYSESGTIRVMVYSRFNRHLIQPYDLEVFGINPDDLEECEFPAEPLAG
jgi:hypothetical protein